MACEACGSRDPDGCPICSPVDERAEAEMIEAAAREARELYEERLDKELLAMAEIAAVLREYDTGVCRRILAWAKSRYA